MVLNVPCVATGTPDDKIPLNVCIKKLHIIFFLYLSYINNNDTLLHIKWNYGEVVHKNLLLFSFSVFIFSFILFYKNNNFFILFPIFKNSNKKIFVNRMNQFLNKKEKKKWTLLYNFLFFKPT